MSATGALGSFLFGFRALGGARREWVGGWGSRKTAALLERKTAQGEERTCCFVPPAALHCVHGPGFGGETQYAPIPCSARTQFFRRQEQRLRIVGSTVCPHSSEIDPRQSKCVMNARCYYFSERDFLNGKEGKKRGR